MSRIASIRSAVISSSLQNLLYNVRGMKCVLVIEKDGSVRQRIPYDTKNGAIIYLYDKESRIVWESVEGRHYTDSIPYETKRLFYEPRFVDMCRKYAASTGFWNQEPEPEKQFS